MSQLTPMFRQYRSIKEQYPDVILLYRMGDFYEMFGEDARTAAAALDLTLTSRVAGKGNRVPMCGVPYHALERYLSQLVAQGFKAAICEQMEDPKLARGLVKRGVTRVVTRGTVIEDAMLEAGSNNFLCALARRGGRIGLAVADVSTGEFTVTELEDSADQTATVEELSRLQPAEILAPSELCERDGFAPRLERETGGSVTPFDLDPLAMRTPYQRLTDHFATESLRGFGCEQMPAAIEAAATVLEYLERNQLDAAHHLQSLSVYSTGAFMTLDTATRRNLELVRSLRDGGSHGTVMWLLDHTGTSMGSRLLRQWILAPLLDREAIQGRLDAVQAFRENALLRQDVRECLRSVADLERLSSRAAAGTANARDLVSLRSSLQQLPRLRALLAESASAPLQELHQRLDPCDQLRQHLERALADDPPVSLREGGLIRDGFHAEVDELRRARTEGRQWIAELESRERQRTGIPSLKVGFNQVFGYYLEITKANLSLAPEDYTRKQTLANAERFITPELKELESKVLGAEEKVVSLEYDLFSQVREDVAAQAPQLLATARAVAEVDVLATFAELSLERNYCRPEMTAGDAIEIEQGRHPVVELTHEEPFVPNDANLDGQRQQLIIVTGPNMAGKSTYLRQVALISLLAQIGCYVPAASARLCLVDRIFTRVGAHDDLATGQSTFMVEMTETANILHHATERSLVILDEIGRGTSTYDGLSIAWAVAERLHEIGAKTLFATHYHHLNELEDRLERAVNYRVAVKEEGDHITFLRQIVRGGTDRSYGIQVARLAGLPLSVIERAKQVLWTLEEERDIGRVQPDRERVQRVAEPVQLTLFEAAPHPVLEALEEVDIDNMTPVEALNLLHDLKRQSSS